MPHDVLHTHRSKVEGGFDAPPLVTKYAVGLTESVMAEPSSLGAIGGWSLHFEEDRLDFHLLFHFFGMIVATGKGRFIHDI